MKMTIKYVIGTSMLALAMGSVNQVNAADASFTLPAGLACLDFDLTLNIDFSDNRVNKEFTDKDGQVVRILSAGKGSDLEFVNDTTGATYSLRGNGSVSHTTINPDGTQTVSAEGQPSVVVVVF